MAEQVQHKVIAETHFPVGHFRCFLEIRADYSITRSWMPKRPKRLSRREIEQYRLARDTFYADTGLRIIVVDLEP